MIEAERLEKEQERTEKFTHEVEELKRLVDKLINKYRKVKKSYPDHRITLIEILKGYIDERVLSEKSNK